MNFLKKEAGRNYIILTGTDGQTGRWRSCDFSVFSEIVSQAGEDGDGKLCEGENDTKTDG